MKIIVHISELEGIQKACAHCELKCLVMETATEGILSVLITDSGREISPALAWSLRGAAEATTRMEKYEKRRISEAELMPSIDITPIEELP